MIPSLGKRDPHLSDHPHRQVRLARYLSPRLPDPPPALDWTGPVTGWGEYGNLEIGDCGVAAPANLIRCLTANAGAQKDLALEDVLAAYTTVSGYDPDDPTTDTGAVLSDVLALWHASGPGGIGGDVIAGFAEVEHHDPRAIKQAVALFGGVILGLQLPLAAQGLDAWIDVPAPRGELGVPSICAGSFDLSGPWAPGSWGGHAVPVVAYDLDGCQAVSWGNTLRVSWRWIAAYVDEAWAVVSADWLRAGRSPAGFDLATLRADLAAISELSAR